VNNEIVTENSKKDKQGLENFCHEFSSKRMYGLEIIACLG